MITGGCLCGAIRYQADGQAIGAGFCYCRDCQKVSGGMPAAIVVFPRRAFRLTAGAPVSYDAQAERGGKVTRSFCGACGAHLFAQNEKHPEMMPVRVGTIDQPFEFMPSVNLWTRSALPWHRLDHALQSFETQPAD